MGMTNQWEMLVPLVPFPWTPHCQVGTLVSHTGVSACDPAGTTGLELLCPRADGCPSTKLTPTAARAAVLWSQEGEFL